MYECHSVLKIKTNFERVITFDPSILHEEMCLVLLILQIKIKIKCILTSSGCQILVIIILQKYLKNQLTGAI